MKKYLCENCQQEKQDVYHVIISDVNGSKFIMLCPSCIEDEKRTSTYKTIKVFSEQELRKSFE
jgi:protein-arginine kinase activator protein McsA